MREMTIPSQCTSTALKLDPSPIPAILHKELPWLYLLQPTMIKLFLWLNPNDTKAKERNNED